MGFLSKLWNWLRSGSATRSKRWHPDLNPIDIQKISGDLNLKFEAHRLGTAGVPRETDLKLTGPEASVVFRVEEARQNYMTWGELRMAALNQELSRKDITQQINQARRADEEFERIASAELTTKSAMLHDLGDVARIRKDELNRFKFDHGIDRLSLAPVGNSKLLIVVLAVVLVGVEGFLNMFFFAKGLDTGLLGGFIEAGIAAAVNVGAAFISGVYLLRFVHHIKPLPKLFGYLTAAATLFFILTMAFGIAHYRDALVMGSDNAMSLALQTLRESPTGLKEMSSWLLFFVSVAFGTISSFDGYKIDDPYPGYGSKFRLADEAIKDYNREIDEINADLEDLKKEMLAQVERAGSHCEASVAIYQNLIGEKQRSGNDLTNAVEGAENALHALLQEFRNENNIARGDNPPPAYFNTWPELRKLKIPDFSTAANEVNLANQRQLLVTFLAELQDIRARIQTAFKTRFNALQTLDAQFIRTPGASGTANYNNLTQAA
jgi:hypothetical protein